MSNYGFVDGHAKALKPTATNWPKNMWSCNDDGPCNQNVAACLQAVEQMYPG